MKKGEEGIVIYIGKRTGLRVREKWEFKGLRSIARGITVLWVSMCHRDFGVSIVRNRGSRQSHDAGKFVVSFAMLQRPFTSQ